MLEELIAWRKKFRKVDGTNKMKLVAFDFQQAMNLQHLKGHQIYSLLRDGEQFIQLLIVSGLTKRAADLPKRCSECGHIVSRHASDCSRHHENPASR
jgi:hypothetical protein